MNIGITGATGFIARHLIPRLAARGHSPFAFSRTPARSVPGCVETRAFLPGQPVDVGGLDAVVNLAGETILGLWTAAKKRRILESRVGTTARLVEAMGRLPDGPRVLVSGSAIGFYGDRGEAVLDEASAPGHSFLPEVARQWEDAATAAERFGARVALLRTGLVYGSDGGAFPPLRRAFRLGLGGRLGSGRQWMSPIHVADEAELIVFLLKNENARGPFNAACPEPVRNADFTRELGQAVKRAEFLPAPAFALRTALGEASQLLLDSTRAVPTQAVELGFKFKYPDVGAILADLV